MRWYWAIWRSSMPGYMPLNRTSLWRNSARSTGSMAVRTSGAAVPSVSSSKTLVAGPPAGVAGPGVAEHKPVVAGAPAGGEPAAHLVGDEPAVGQPGEHERA